LGCFRIYLTNAPRSTFEDGYKSKKILKQNWIPLKPDSVEFNVDGTTASIRDNGTVLIKGKNQPATYTVRAQTKLRGITGIRLDTVLDDSLPSKGPGRGMFGNFVISKIEVDANPLFSDFSLPKSLEFPEKTVFNLRRKELISNNPFQLSRWRTRYYEETVIPAKAGIVIIDLWEENQCKKLTEIASKLIPRLNKVIQVARKMGFRIIHAPAGGLSYYESSPQRLALIHMKKFHAPEINHPFHLFLLPWSLTGRCECGPSRPCLRSWTSNNFSRKENNGIQIADNDLIIDPLDTDELYSICKNYGLSHLFYVGMATNICVQGHPAGMQKFSEIGLKCILIRDLTFGQSGNGYNPDTDRIDSTMTPERGDSIIVDYIERYLAPTVQSQEFLKYVFK